MAPLFVESSLLHGLHLTGLGRFVARLIEALSRQRPLRLCTLGEGAEGPPREVIAIDAPLPPADHDVQQWAASVRARPRRPPDADPARSPCLYTYTRPARRLFAREVSVIYDFTPALLPEMHVAETRRQLGAFYSRTLPLADAALAISQCTRHDATWLSDLAPESIVAAYPGPSLCDRRHAAPPAAKRQPEMLLVVATREPRKNAPLVLEWFQRSSALPADAELWWVGPRGWLWRPPARDRQARRPVHFLGAVSDAALCDLYQRATCTVYASLYEGFGFPVLDSLWHGTPVITSFNSSLKEFSGPAVFHVDPCDPSSLDDAYRRLRAAPPPAIDRDALAATYSWDRLAETACRLLAS